MPVFTCSRCCSSRAWSIFTLKRNISFSRSVRVSTSFGVNCASGEAKETLAGSTSSGNASSTMRASAP